MSATLLAIDTSTTRAALALSVEAADGTSRLHVSRPDPSPRHGRVLIPAIHDLLAEAGLRIDQLDGLAVSLGPGSYTGLRIGLTAAKTLAYAIGKPLVGLDSLEVVARNAPDGARYVAAISDAQRGDLHAAEFVRDAVGGPLLRISETRIVSLDDWRAILPDDAYVLGPALEVARLLPRIPSHLQRPDDPEGNRPDPNILAELAQEVWQTGRREDIFFVEPLYLRRSAAEDLWDRKGEARPS